MAQGCYEHLLDTKSMVLINLYFGILKRNIRVKLIIGVTNFCGGVSIAHFDNFNVGKPQQN